MHPSSLGRTYQFLTMATAFFWILLSCYMCNDIMLVLWKSAHHIIKRKDHFQHMEKIHFEALMCVCFSLQLSHGWHWSYISVRRIRCSLAWKLGFNPISMFALPIMEPLVEPRNLKLCLEEGFCNDDDLFWEFRSVQPECWKMGSSSTAILLNAFGSWPIIVGGGRSLQEQRLLHAPQRNRLVLCTGVRFHMLLQWGFARHTVDDDDDDDDETTDAPNQRSLRRPSVVSSGVSGAHFFHDFQHLFHWLACIYDI